MRIRSITPLLLLAAGGCAGDPTGPEFDVALVIEVESVDGSPVRGASVRWYFPPESAQYTGELQALCIDRACTAWTVPEWLTGSAIYVVASRIQVAPYAPGCWYSAYDAAPVTVEAGVRKTVTLRLDLSTMSCTDA